MLFLKILFKFNKARFYKINPQNTTIIDMDNVILSSDLILQSQNIKTDKLSDNPRILDNIDLYQKCFISNSCE